MSTLQNVYSQNSNVSPWVFSICMYILLSKIKLILTPKRKNSISELKLPTVHTLNHSVYFRCTFLEDLRYAL